MKSVASNVRHYVNFALVCAIGAAALTVPTLSNAASTTLSGTQVVAAAAATPSVPQVAVNIAPTISGTAPPTINVGTPYHFTPRRFDANGNTLTFSVRNLPAWAKFNTVAGAVYGTPSAADVGTYTGIQISVTDGTAVTTLPAFSISVNQMSAGNAVIDWTPPTDYTDGSVMTNLAGYNVHYGTSSTSMTQTIKVTNPGLTSYVVDNLASGTWYFMVTAYTSDGTESTRSGVVSTQIL